MAKRKIGIPYMLREICAQLAQGLQLDLGVPMNAELPPSTTEHADGTARVHFPFRNFIVTVRTSTDASFGECISITSAKCALRMCEHEALPWIENLQRFSGPIKWTYEDGKLRFELAGKRWARLAMNASNRRNGLPEFVWDDPEHPWVVWARQTGALVYPTDLPEGEWEWEWKR